MTGKSNQSGAQTTKVSVFQLAAFFKGFVLYFIFYKYDFLESQLLSTVLKCSPIFSLMMFLLMNDFKEPKQAHHKNLIFAALFFSIIGDICLDYKAGGMDAFTVGMVSFAVAHIFYITAFGFENLRPLVGVAVFIIAASTLSVIYSSVSGIFRIAVPVYTLFLGTTGWRALARIKRGSFSEIFCAIGAASFAISDTCIVFNLFYSPFSNAQVYIIFTYYLAQLGLTLSVLDVGGMDSKKVK